MPVDIHTPPKKATLYVISYCEAGRRFPAAVFSQEADAEKWCREQRTETRWYEWEDFELDELPIALLNEED